PTLGRRARPHGGVVTTARDLARYAQVMINGQSDVISAEGKALMMSPANESAEGYGLGWSLYAPAGVVWHSGANPGFQAQITMRPETGDMALFLTNAGSGYGFGETGSIGYNLILDLLDLDAPRTEPQTLIKGVFVLLVLVPFLNLFLAIRQWQKRQALPSHGRVRRSVVTLVHALLAIGVSWALLRFVPAQFGIPFSGLALFVPDWGLILQAVAASFFLLAIVRLFVDRRAGQVATGT
ncbi:MAG: serine hydrolase, partial [Pseudomonadota bacterium]